MKTLKQMRDHVKADLDLEDELFITDADIDRWINEGISSAEHQIHTLYEDYFLSEATITAVSGQNLYDYPGDIYANKIRKIIYRDNSSNSTTNHVVKRVKDLAHAVSLDLYLTSSNPFLMWGPINDATNGRKIRIFPKAARDGFLDVWYIRNAKQLVNDSDVCDIDEFEKFVIQYAKTQAYMKDNDPRVEDSSVLQLKYENDMVLTLSEMVPDRDNEITADMSHYDEMVGDCYWEDC